MKKSVVALLHFVYWSLYLFLILFLTQLVWSMTNPGFIMKFDTVLLVSVSAIIPGTISFYCFYTFLFSLFLSERKILYLFIFGIITVISCALIGDITMTIVYMRNSPFGHHTLFADGWTSAIGITVMISIFAFANGGMGLIIKGFITSYSDIKLKEELNKKNYEVELELVKSQINPHFLFNTINNIDVLIEKDAAKASAYLNKLSDIMRFMLYETKTEKISLEKELTYIEKYIELQKIRTTNSTYVNYSVVGDQKNLMIAPMLFIPFIENAFKHAENKKIENAINIKITIEKELIIFDCENNYTNETQIKPDQRGLGNKLIQKRLALLYPNKHTLEIINRNNTYKVKLSVLQK